MTQRIFNADLARFDKLFTDADALVTYDDGFVGIDQTKVPASALRSYNLLIQFGYANGLI